MIWDDSRSIHHSQHGCWVALAAASGTQNLSFSENQKYRMLVSESTMNDSGSVDENGIGVTEQIECMVTFSNDTLHENNKCVCNGNGQGL
jgi:hypothetical protein